MRILRIVLAALCFGYANLTHAATIGFESFSSVVFPGSSYSEAGFTIVPTGDPNSQFLAPIYEGLGCSPVCADSGSASMGVFSNNGNSITVASNSGTPFSFLDFQGGETFVGYPSWWANDIQVIGVRPDGTNVATSFRLDGINDGPGGVTDFQTFSMPAGFSSLASVQFVGSGGSLFNGFSLDNINVSPVPEPSAYVMLLAGLGLLGFVVHRRKPNALAV